MRTSINAAVPLTETPRRSIKDILMRSLGKLPLRFAIGVLLIIEVYPLVWLLLSSFKANSEFTSNPMWVFPSALHWQNYADAFTQANMGVYFMNSILTVFPSLLFILVLSTAAGFALEVMRWRGRNILLL